MASDVTIPKRSLFKPAEVCSIAGVQPYILRSWEAEFPKLARGKKAAGPRVYRRADVQMVLRIKELVFGEGLTLGAARRKLEADASPETVEEVAETLGALVDADARERLAEVKSGLRSILDLLTRKGANAIIGTADVKTAEASVQAGKPAETANEETA